MKKKIDLRRRVVVVAALGGVSLATVALTGHLGGLSGDRQLSFLSLVDAEKEIARLAQAHALQSDAAWNWAQTLEHCAQSIKYSMTGYPQSKSELFQKSVGTAAFEWFAWRGRMSHDLSEPIPGAPPLAPATDATAALQRLIAAIENFRIWREPLQPHFAYGSLSKSQYELAHALHIANHLSHFSATG